jgi:hypothetical protein
VPSKSKGQGFHNDVRRLVDSEEMQ